MCSNSVLKERINNNEKQNSKEHLMVFDKLTGIEDKVLTLISNIWEKTTIYDDRYVLRRDFRIAIWIISWVLWVLTFIYWVGL